MVKGRKHALVLFTVVWCCVVRVIAQDLAPRAYLITPVHASTVNLTWSFYSGGLNFNGTIPVTGATGTYSVPTISVYHAFDVFGRAANLTVSQAYGVGTFSGDVLGRNKSVYRSGLFDFTARASVNLVGGPAMQAEQFAKWRQKIIVGASIKLVAPTGQYAATKLLNWGINRWAFKPEVGYSERWGHWILDAYGGAWFYTRNPGFYDIPEPVPQTESPIGSFEGHLSYSFKNPRKWASIDSNFWWGGITTLNSVRNLETKQTASRVGATLSLPFTQHQSVRCHTVTERTSVSAATTTMCRWDGSIHGWENDGRAPCVSNW